MKRKTVIQSIVVGDTESFTLYQISEHCQIESDRVIEFVEYGMLEPEGQAQEEWQFSAHDLVRMQKALRLINDLDVNYSGAALALELLEEVDDLKSELNCLRRLMSE
jgi:chaperone modulatory protein CbpM